MNTRFSHLVFAVIVAIGIVLFGCQNMPGTRQQQGAVIGGATGAVAGHEIGGGRLGTIIGAVAGGVIGAKIGERMEPNDRQNTAQALSENQSRSWTNPNTKTSYTVNPIDTVTQNGQTCRDYTMTTTIEGNPQQVNGRACRQPDGTWKTAQG